MRFIKSLYGKLKAVFRLVRVLAGVEHVDPIEVNYVLSTNEVIPIVSKSGCSTVKLCIIRRFNSVFESSFPEIHSVNIEVVTSGEITYHTFPSVGVYGRFCVDKNMILVVRDPYLRFVSCYRGVVSEKNVMYAHPSRLNELFSFAPTITLASFLNIISWIPDRLADRHFRSQSYYLTGMDKGGSNSIKIVELENFVKQWTETGNVRLNNGQSPEDEKMIEWLKQSEKFQSRYKTDIELYEKLRS